MKRSACVLALAAAALLLSACLGTPTSIAPTDSGAPAQPDAPTVSPSPAGTIQWFPATRTPVPLPTVEQSQPTVESRPAQGAVVFSDDFSAPAAWSGMGPAAAGTASMGGGELTLALPGQAGMLVSLRNTGTVSDFSLEITSNLSLCRGNDNYGVLVRAASSQDYYRFLVACNGQARVERVKNGKIALLQDWTYSGQVPPGAPLLLKLGVWAAGSDLRFFIDDIFQFAVKDAVLQAGTVGVFARSSGQTPLTVSFSNLVVRAVDASAVPTLPSTPTTTPTVTRTLAGPTRTSTPVFMKTATPKN